MSAGIIVSPTLRTQRTQHIPAQAFGSTTGVAATAGTHRTFVWTLVVDVDFVTTTFLVPTNWNAGSDITARLIWASLTSSAIADTETVRWDYEWYNAAEDKLIQSATTTASTALYTQSGAGVAGEIIKSLTFPLDYDDATNAFARGDLLSIKLNPDSTCSYDSGAYTVHFLGLTLEWNT